MRLRGGATEKRRTGRAGRCDAAGMRRGKALRRLRSTKKDTVVFEDALHALRTAHEAGFRTAAVYDESEPDQEEMRRLADYYIESFEEMTLTE